MLNENQAKRAALKFLVGADNKATYKYVDTLITVSNYFNNMSHKTACKAMSIIYEAGYVICAGECMFDKDCWHNLVRVITDSMRVTETYTSTQIHDIVIDAIGVDIDDIVSVLLQQKLIRTVSRYVNGRYITVYAKNW